MWYKVLKVSKNATREEVEASYRKISSDPSVVNNMEESIKVRNAYSEAMETFTDLSGYVTNHTTANTTANYDDGEKGVKGVVEKMEQVKDKKGEPVFKVDKTLFEEKPKKESSDIDVRNVIRIIRLVLFIGFILYAIFS